ncbi:epoxide hydrolase N terminus-domain-containing protein [Chaetomidium leptoderma]|uniref:Epoxide hydrolase N terminus-domain-containing protein n=1 Tax=Chaetomidium leptoderma TaxID=669021 RepID=A0AAN6VP93_9PEZI|nr:epoxide hydrolase N terminus-domain-containing protein [Chaetomidium leptoderma]
MSLSAFGIPPPGILTAPTPFTFNVPQREQDHLTKLVRQAAIGVPSYYNTQTDTANLTTTFGLSRDWLVGAQDAWTSSDSPLGYSWRAEQRRLNRIPNFRINVTATNPFTTTTTTTTSSSSEGEEGEQQQEEEKDEQVFDLHFAALFSRRPDATPVMLLHGWPGSWNSEQWAQDPERPGTAYSADRMSIGRRSICASSAGEVLRGH